MLSSVNEATVPSVWSATALLHRRWQSPALANARAECYRSIDITVGVTATVIQHYSSGHFATIVTYRALMAARREHSMAHGYTRMLG